MAQQRIRVLACSLAILGVYVSTLMTSGCGSNSSSQQLKKNTVTDVYVAGWENSSLNSIALVAKYWKNGNPVVLSQQPSEAYAIAVSGNDVYVAGQVAGSTHDIAVYWKNGVEADLTDGSSEAEADSIFVQGTDVYVAGRDGDAAMYWKNGAPVVLDANALVSNVIVSGADVYVAGWKYRTTQIDPTHIVDYPVALYWKNGDEVDLTDGRVTAYANSIFLLGSDVYVAGATSSATYATDLIPTYWKNGSALQLPGNDSFNWAAWIWANGTDVYVAGNDLNLNNRTYAATTWKDGTRSDLWNGNDTSNASQVTVDGTDVYISGDLSANGGIQRAGYWKNGQRVDVSSSTEMASAKSIVVVTH